MAFPRGIESRASDCQKRDKVSPLPEGEGQGEGEGSVICLDASEFTRSFLFQEFILVMASKNKNPTAGFGSGVDKSGD